jgi:hypothetical protein
MEYESDIEAIIKGEVDRKWQSLSPEQAETLRRFNVACENDGLIESARKSKLKGVAKFGMDIGKPYEKITAEDLEDWFVSERIEQSAMAIPKKTQVKKFFQWLYGYEGSNYPPVVDWIREGAGSGGKAFVSLTEGDMSKVMDVATDALGKIDTIMPTIGGGQPAKKEKKRKKEKKGKKEKKRAK